MTADAAVAMALADRGPGRPDRPKGREMSPLAGLTPRESEIVALIVRGHSNKASRTTW